MRRVRWLWDFQLRPPFHGRATSTGMVGQFAIRCSSTDILLPQPPGARDSYRHRLLQQFGSYTSGLPGSMVTGNRDGLGWRGLYTGNFRLPPGRQSCRNAFTRREVL